MSTKEIILQKSAEIKAVAARHGANNVRLFGSVARDEQGPESDIDFLVDAGPPDTSPWFPAGLILDLEDMLRGKVEVVNRGRA